METRRQRYSEATKQALVEVAERLFTAHGYSATSLDAIAAGADVTKGALYHHFSGKQAIFEAAFERVQSRATTGIADAAAGHPDPWDKAQAGMRAFLEAVQEPGYRQVVVSDGPSVLGHERYREQEERSTYALVDEIVRSVLTAEGRDLDDAMLDTFTRIFFGAMSAAGGSVAVSDDPAAAAAAGRGGDRRHPGRAPAPPRRRRRSAGAGDYFANVTLPLTAGTSSTHTWPAGTVRSPPLVESSIAPVRPSLVQVPFTTRPPWKSSAAPLPSNLVSGHRVAGRVAVARVADADPQHEHGVGRELVALRGVGVGVDVAALLELPAGGVGAEVGGERAGLRALRQVGLVAPREVGGRLLLGLEALGDVAELGEEVVGRRARRLAVDAGLRPR